MYTSSKIRFFYVKCEPIIKSFNQSYNIFRHVRNASKRNDVLKTIKDFKIKKASDYDDYYQFVDYDDLSKRIKENDLDIEETFSKGEDLQSVVSECNKIHDIHKSQESKHRSFVKKKLVGRKYFKMEKETNLLTHAAKEQIRYLHDLDPSEWSPEAIANSFPISVNGAKKLLRSNFVLSTPERIKEHDEDVKRKWEILNSGERSEIISFHTQRLWNDGKLSKENYNGNPNLPNSSRSKHHRTVEEIIVKKQKNPGEYASILQNYVEYKIKKQSLQKNNSALIVKSENVGNNTNFDDEDQKVKKISKYLRGDERANSKVKQFDKTEFPFSQFKENIREDLRIKSKSSATHKQYYEWIEDNPKKEDPQSRVQPYKTNELVSKISKYDNSNKRIDIKRDNKSFYVYDEKLGYQTFKGQNIKSKIHVSDRLKKKNAVYKVGQCVYDGDGEFLYKLPT